MNPELVKFHLPTTDQFSVAVDNRSANTPENRLLADLSAVCHAAAVGGSLWMRIQKCEELA
jgi:hypothetical protein